MTKAIIDANVWFKQELTNLILTLAKQETFFVYWTLQIQNEWIENKIKNIKEKGTPKTKTELQKIQTNINKEFADSIITNYENLIPKMTNHHDDRHVLAAAVYAECDTIITYNKKHFFPDSIAPYEIDVLTPDEFLLPFTNETHPHFLDFTNTLKTQRLNLKNPPLTATQYLALLDGGGQTIPRTAKKCKKFSQLI